MCPFATIALARPLCLSDHPGITNHLAGGLQACVVSALFAKALGNYLISVAYELVKGESDIHSYYKQETNISNSSLLSILSIHIFTDSGGFFIRR